ncbi:general secretion pathway protein GspN [Gluconacetobacter asukensis]|uniref:General secretion pathway protein GspN n=1 Tax=Gluconacetobacter asukensis TaxID=1017181 RepID=A0A7W4J2G6_9PROT|nr:general secretion pathway protein GspN [Gluconacetobacter asukensis]MBB2173470.1 general secretion pathway protein GspN [Gluconacetobacter asukensis]
MIHTASRSRRPPAACLAAIMLGACAVPTLAAPPTQNAQNQPDTAQIDSWQQTILARPLFSPIRRPAEMQAMGDTTPRLTGIVVSRGRRRAIFMIPGQARGRIADVGETVGPWQIIAIENGAIRVRGAAGEQAMRPDRDRRTDSGTRGTSPASLSSQPPNPRPEEQ